MYQNQYESVLLIDVNNIAKRLFEAKKSGAYLKSMSVFTRARDHLAANHVVACFDGGNASDARKQIIPTYKAERHAKKKKTNEKEYLQTLRELYKAMSGRWHTEAHRGFEADDGIGALVSRLKPTPDRRVFIMSNDNDLLQLIKQDCVAVLHYYDGDMTVFTEAGMRAKYGLAPSQWLDCKIIQGDSSDEIAGVVGVGEKTAIPWLQEFGSIEQCLKNTDKLSGGKRKVEALIECHRSGELEKIREVLRLWTHCPVTWQWPGDAAGEPCDWLDELLSTAKPVTGVEGDLLAGLLNSDTATADSVVERLEHVDHFDLSDILGIDLTD